jgi:hypothetical protein
MHHEPATGTIERALRPRLGFLEKIISVDDFDVGFSDIGGFGFGFGFGSDWIEDVDSDGICRCVGFTRGLFRHGGLVVR